jgi:hypothetical protein
MSKVVVEVLKAARGLVENGWTQRTSARDVIGLAISAESEKACSFCVTGAVWKAAKKLGVRAIVVIDEMDAYCDRLHGKCAMQYNDDPGRSKGEVLELFDGCITAITVKETPDA